MDDTSKDFAKKIVSELSRLNRSLELLLGIANRPREHDEQSPNPQNDAANQNDSACRKILSMLETRPCPESTKKTEEKWYRTVQGWKDRVELLAFGFAIFYAVVTYLQWRDSKENFRTDQRPYLVQAPMGTPNEVTVVASGDHAGEFQFSLHLSNYGKSPAIVTTSYFHVYVGDAEIATIGQNEINTSDRTGMVIPAGDKPVIAIYSNRLSADQIATINANLNAIPIPIIVYGHIEYTDIFPHQKPTYSSGFCGPLGINASRDTQSKECKNLQYIR
jgi:hypothetical protein